MQNVAFFSNQFADAEGHGLARYARELHAALADQKQINTIPMAAWSSLSQRQLEKLCNNTGLQISALGRRLTPLMWNYLNFPPVERLFDEKVDVVHAVSLGYPIATKRPFVVTIHDLGPLTHPEYFSNTKPWIMERSLQQAHRQADIIICVSQSTADEVCGYLGEGVADRIRIIHEGVSPAFSEAPDTTVIGDLDLPTADIPIILSAGKLSPRKNVQGVLKAMSRVSKDIPHHLVLVGGQGWDTVQVLDELADPELRSRVHLLNYVTDIQLRALYHRAALYVHPSYYEGFGLTVLEAMASGTPVVTSNTTSLPEVAGKAAVLVDPCDEGALAEAIRKVCLSSALREKMMSLGLERSKLFKWSNCAKKIANIYEEVA